MLAQSYLPRLLPLFEFSGKAGRLKGVVFKGGGGILNASAKKRFTSGGRNPRPDGLRPPYASRTP
jgi:hypothetical protein